MYHVSTQGVDARMINVHHYYYYRGIGGAGGERDGWEGLPSAACTVPGRRA